MKVDIIMNSLPIDALELIFSDVNNPQLSSVSKSFRAAHERLYQNIYMVIYKFHTKQHRTNFDERQIELLLNHQKGDKSKVISMLFANIYERHELWDIPVRKKECFKTHLHKKVNCFGWYYENLVLDFFLKLSSKILSETNDTYYTTSRDYNWNKALPFIISCNIALINDRIEELFGEKNGFTNNKISVRYASERLFLTVQNPENCGSIHKQELLLEKYEQARITYHRYDERMKSLVERRVAEYQNIVDEDRDFFGKAYVDSLFRGGIAITWDQFCLAIDHGNQVSSKTSSHTDSIKLNPYGCILS